MYYIANDYLMHHGVKGMKWGVRKDPQRFANGIKKVTYSKGYRKAVGGLGRSPFGKAAVRVGSISNPELRKNGTARKEYEQKLSSDKSAKKKAKEQVKQAKQEYKQAKKQYDKDFRKYYNKSISAWSPVDKHRRNNEKRFQKALVSSGEMAIKKGNYLQAKGKLRDNQKAINKGKFIANRASLAKKYNSTVLSDLNKGYTLREAHGKNQKLWSNSVKKQSDMTAEYRRNR